MGKEWGYLALYRTDRGVRLGAFRGRYEQYDDATELLESIAVDPDADEGYVCYLQVDIQDGGGYRFSYSRDGEHYTAIGPALAAREGVWIGAKLGIFALSPNLATSDGYADFAWFRVH
jgi:Beta xylosidase C-terminal Concanavalin A-like domain